VCGGKGDPVNMKILFLCGSLQPGQDGVGDYTRRLAGELIRQGHGSSIIAIHDNLISELLSSEESDLDQVFQTLRLPATMPWKRRLKLIQTWIQEYNPDWISLQYVPFAFQNKGLPFLLGAQLKKISEGRKWHLMFHELWVREKTLKFRVLAALQKDILKKLIKNIDAHVIHTHLPLYHNDLSQYSIFIRKLPLYSNFKKPIVKPKDDPGTMRVGFFNLVGEDPKIMSFLKALYKQSIERGLNFEILLIGGATDNLRCFGNKLEKLQEFDHKVKYTGFLTDEMVSVMINRCNVGITPLPLSFVGKSGTSAAFLSQGVPLAIPMVDQLNPPFFDQKLRNALLLEPDLDKLLVATKAARRARELISLKNITKIFINDLTVLPS
jgi:hypothetical protein